MISNAAGDAFELRGPGDALALPAVATPGSQARTRRLEAVIAPSGVLNRHGAARLTAALEDAMDAGVQTITVDLRDVEQIYMYGTDALLLGQLRADDLGIALSLIPGPPAVQRALDRTEAPFNYR